ncbi:MAG: tetratricopeptide repeat protein [Thermoleophilia bacterium]|nr:tetratricopeptide repeat protein [Thermoleophilia bacterium]
MIARIGRNSLVILTVIALIALVGIVAGCEGDDATTTTVAGSTATTAADATTTTAGESTESTTESTAPLGKSLDDYKAEIPALQQAVEADPSDLYALEKLAVAHYQVGEYEQAEAAYLKILAIQEDAFTRNNLGNVYRDWGKTDEAKAAYKKAIEEDPTLKYPYVNLSGVLQKEGDVEGALELLQEGTKHMTEDGQSMLDAAEEKLTSTTTT